MRPFVPNRPPKRSTETVAVNSGSAGEQAQADRLLLAQLLHDSLCQTLSAAQILASLIARKAAERGPIDSSDERVLAEMVSTAVNEVHAIVRQLRSPAVIRPTENNLALDARLKCHEGNAEIK